MQIVGYETATAEAPGALRLASAAGDLERIPLAPGTELSLSLGDRRCAGAVTDEGHRSCPEPAAPHCDAHTSRWPCARCTGDCDYPVAACREPHAVYLAVFAPDVFKVGVTREWRLERRLREQGADRGVQIRTAEDGRRARRIEAGLADRDDLVDRVRVPEKITGLHRAVDTGRWTALLEGFEVTERVAPVYDHDLHRPAVPATHATGTVLGSQGRALLLERAGTSYAVDLRDLVGYEVSDGRPAAAVQSGLGAFD